MSARTLVAAGRLGPMFRERRTYSRADGWTDAESVDVLQTCGRHVESFLPHIIAETHATPSRAHLYRLCDHCRPTDVVARWTLPDGARVTRQRNGVEVVVRGPFHACRACWYAPEACTHAA